MNIPEKLSTLARTSMKKTFAHLDQIDSIQKTALLIEACRAFDYWNVQQNFGKENKLQGYDFTIISKGWNTLLSQLLPSMRIESGVPLMESDQHSIMNITSLLRQLGCATLLKESAAMVYHGMAKAEIVADNSIILKMTDRAKIDRFLDEIEADKLNGAMRSLRSDDPYGEYRVDNLEQRLEALVFPWETSQGTMIGYNAEPDIDDHYLSLIMETTLDWRNEAGIHPDIEINGILGSNIIAIASLIVSANLKHIHLIWAGMRKIPNANYFMSMTIWKDRVEYIESISGFTGIDKEKVSQVLNLLTIDQSNHEYFKNENTPFVPLLIKISDNCLLMPISSIFRNPFHGIRMLHERSYANSASIQKPREDWMINDLYHLFLGNRYRILDKPIKLKKDRKIVTDIDAAIYDTVNGDLALFQLKWQDFTSDDLKKQKSKAKNFVDQIDDWTRRTSGWIEELGFKSLFQSLQIPMDRPAENVRVKIFAIGRSRARFQSYGYAPKNDTVACVTWTQFTRLRYEVGPADDVFGTLHKKIKDESMRELKTTPQPFEINIGDQKIVFEDLRSSYDTEKDK